MTCNFVVRGLLSRCFAPDARWPRLTEAAAVISWFTALALLLLLALAGFPRISGLTERVFLGSALLWMLVVAWHLTRDSLPYMDDGASARMETRAPGMP